MFNRYCNEEEEDSMFMHNCLLNGSLEKGGKERPLIRDQEVESVSH